MRPQPPFHLLPPKAAGGAGDSKGRGGRGGRRGRAAAGGPQGPAAAGEKENRNSLALPLLGLHHPCTRWCGQSRLDECLRNQEEVQRALDVTEKEMEKEKENRRREREEWEQERDTMREAICQLRDSMRENCDKMEKMEGRHKVLSLTFDSQHSPACGRMRGCVFLWTILPGCDPPP